MSRQPDYTGRFRKDLKRMEKRGAALSKIKAVMSKLIDEAPLPAKHRDHALAGDYRGSRECHITPDWLLIYRIENDTIMFTRTGTHSDLFG